MNVNSFMSENIIVIEDIIKGLNRPFDSHLFIQKFSKVFQTNYIQFLSEYSNDPFIKVHGQISKFLFTNQTKLDIKQNGKVISQNIFGEQSECEQWI